MLLQDHQGHLSHRGYKGDDTKIIIRLGSQRSQDSSPETKKSLKIIQKGNLTNLLEI